MKRILIRVLSGTGVIFCVLIVALVLDAFFPPHLNRYTDTSKELRDKSGNLLHVTKSNDDKWRLKTQLSEVDPAFIQLLVGREDKYYWYHFGFNPFSLGRALIQLVTNGRIVSGGSTLTMQVARLLDPQPRSFWAKALQIARAIQLEYHYTKSEILEMYLTLAPYGSNLEGLRSASLAYFSREPKQLIPHEAALLIALPQSPKLWKRTGFTQETLQARNRILKVAYDKKLINRETFEIALKDPLPDASFSLPRELPHMARRFLTADCEKQPFITTVDIKLQKRLESSLQDSLKQLPEGASVAILVVHHPSREVLAYVASPDFYDQQRQGQVDYILAYRSPGSTLKPFIYGMGFDYGYLKPTTYVLDDRRRFGNYVPDNFDKRFYGMVTASEALVMSLNIPVVQLLSQIGPQRFLSVLEEVGVRPKFMDPNASPGLSLALGGLGLTLEQLVLLYAGLPQNGLVAPLNYSPNQHCIEPTPLLTERSSAHLSEILSYCVTNELGIPLRQFAVKTGTSYGHRDAWAVGYNDQYVVGIWVGRPDGSSLGLATGRTLAVPILQKTFRFLPSATLRQLPKQEDLKLRDTSYDSIRIYKEVPQMLFPVDATMIESFNEEKSDPIVLHAMGGKRPYTWLVDGFPVAVKVWKPRTSWNPEKPGFYNVTLIDAQGLSQTAHIEIK